MTGFVVALILRFAYPPEGGAPEGFAPPDNIYEILESSCRNESTTSTCPPIPLWIDLQTTSI